jgi:CRISPR-associated protein Csd2
MDNNNSIVDARYDFVYFFDCKDGNPNGDPDADNSPRFDPETFQGLVSDVCLKRKIRDWVFQRQQTDQGITPGYEIFVLSGGSLESRQKLPYDNLNLTPKSRAPGDIAKARDWMCQNFFDVRAFGAVMSTTDFNCGQVRGPVQITFARSIDRVFTTEHTISRQAHTTEKDQASKAGTGTFGRKHTVAYGLYRAQGFINANFAKQTGFSHADLELLWAALANMFDIDRSASRGLMTARDLFVFKHSSALGEAPAQKLFDLVTAHTRDGIETPRSYSDYVVSGPSPDKLPKGVELLTPLLEPAIA